MGKLNTTFRVISDEVLRLLNGTQVAECIAQGRLDCHEELHRKEPMGHPILNGMEDMIREISVRSLRCFCVCVDCCCSDWQGVP